MKRILLVLIICVSQRTMFSQSTFSLQVKLSTNCFPGLPVKAYDNSLLVPISTETGLYISRIDMQGKIVWEKTYGSHAEKTPFICATPDNGFVSFAYILDSIKSQNEIVVFKCDSSGNIQWTKFIGLSYDDYFAYPAQIITDSKGNYVIAYSLGPKALYQTEEIHIVKFDKYGNLVFQTGFKNLYTAGQYQGLKIQDIIETFDGGFLVGLQYACSSCGEYLPHGFFLQTNKQGDLISYKTFRPYHYYGYGDYDYPLTLFKHNSRYYLLGYFNRYSNESKYYYIASFDESTNNSVSKLVPYNKYALQKVLNENNINSLSADKYIVDDKNLISLTTIDYNSKYTLLELNRYDSLGKICPDYQLPTFNYDTSYKLFSFGDEKTGVLRSNDSLLITSSGINSKRVHNIQAICLGDNKIELKKLQPDKSISVNTSAFLFPNPANNTITVSTPSLINKQIQLSLFNSNGKMLQSFSVYTNSNNYIKTINIASYAKGVYIIKISDTHQTQILKFIKQ
ncbi:MAG: T9SS type A sorting domain-containing protein [Parafilimonas sp.]